MVRGIRQPQGMNNPRLVRLQPLSRWRHSATWQAPLLTPKTMRRSHARSALVTSASTTISPSHRMKKQMKISIRARFRQGK
jgi:hypothetical protein